METLRYRYGNINYFYMGFYDYIRIILECTNKEMCIKLLLEISHYHTVLCTHLQEVKLESQKTIHTFLNRTGWKQLKKWLKEMIQHTQTHTHTHKHMHACTVNTHSSTHMCFHQ